MSYRGKRPGGGLETEIEKAREEGVNVFLPRMKIVSFVNLGNWRRVIELANQLKERPDTVKQFEPLGWFLIGE